MIAARAHTSTLRGAKTNDGGFTLIEIVFTAGVLVVGLVMLMGSAVNVAAQSKVSEMRSQALQFNLSVIESLRGRSLGDLLQFNSDGSELEVSEDGYITLEGLGNAALTIEYVVPAEDDSPASFVALPLTEEQMEALDESAMPNPLEVRVTLSIQPGASGPAYNFYSSALLGY